MQEFAYFQEQDSEQFAFYNIPKVLFTDPRFNEISTNSSAKERLRQFIESN